MLIVLRVLVFLAGVYASQTHIEKHWVVGPVFGAVALFWHWSFSKRFDAGRFARFFLSSVLIYAGVVELMKIDTPETGIMQFFIPGMLAGTVALLLAHKFFLGLSGVRVAIGIPAVYVAAYAAGTFFSGMPNGFLRTLFSAVGFWQAAYLAVAFIPDSKTRK